VTATTLKAMVVLTDGNENPGPYTRRSIADVTDLINSLNGRVLRDRTGPRRGVESRRAAGAVLRQSGLHADDRRPDARRHLPGAKYYQQIFAE